VPTILVVDDEPAYRDALRAALQREGFGVDVAADGPEALRRVTASPPDLVLLDLMLPGMSGIDVCREIRKSSAVPIIMVTARDSELETVVGLEVGADDYVTKPFRLRELVARVRATLRRSVTLAATNGATTTVTSGEAIEIADVCLDGASHEVTVRGEPVHLPRKEFELLELLMLNAGIVITRDTLIDRVWGGDYVGDTKTLDVHVKRIRAKIEEDPATPRRITTIRGVGYRYEKR
jgi:two-component system, OmpR family, response regulator RegX3